MYENLKAVIIPKDSNDSLNGLVVEFNNNTLIVECRVSKAIALNKKAKIFIYSSVKGESEYEGEITDVTKNVVVLRDVTFVKNTQKRQETRVNVDLALQVRKIILGDGQIITLPRVLEMQTLDLSAGGISLLCTKDIKEHVRLPIELPIDNKTIPCIAEIIRKEVTVNGFYCYGCKFVGLAEHMQDKIRGYVYKMQVKARKH